MEAKTHPNLHPSGYEGLPFSEKVKDFTFWAVIRGISLYLQAIQSSVDKE